MDKNNSSKNNKTDVITIRVKPGEKNKIKKYANKQGISISKYMLNASLKKHTESQRKNGICDVMTVQEICRHIEELYGEDKFLERKCEELWDSL